MTEKNEPAAAWHHTMVILRADIYRMALDQGIDISDACNRVLADKMGIDYRQKLLEEPAVPASVIIARDGTAARRPAAGPVSPAKNLQPVINADDPGARTKVKQAGRQTMTGARQETPAPVQPREEKKVDAPPLAAVPKKEPVTREKKTPAGKKPKREGLKLFFSSKLARQDDQDATISKDELYETFTRWCRDHRILPVPDRRSVMVALKNQFALQETVVGGVPSWTGIRLK
jgi:hypothetical protein